MDPLLRYVRLLEEGTLLDAVASPVLVWKDPIQSSAENTGSLTHDRGPSTPRTPKRNAMALVFELTGAIPGGLTLLLGRGNSCAVQVVEKTVSRRHTELKLAHDDGWTATDLASKNGTWVGSTRLTPGRPTALADGARIQVGGVELFFMKPASFHAYLAQLLEHHAAAERRSSG